MSDVGWGSDHLEPPKKRKIPIWVLGCAGGCMFALGAAAVGAFFVKNKVMDWIDTQSKPEVQWPKLVEVLPFDEVPAGFSISRIIPIVDIWQLDSLTEDLVVFVFAGPEHANASPWGKWFSDPKKAPMFQLQDGELEAVEGKLVIQGREVRSVRITRTLLPEDARAAGERADPGEHDPAQTGGSQDAPPLSRSKSIRGNGLALDVTAEGSDKRVLVWLMRSKDGATVSDDEAKVILAPFKIGPAR